MPRAAFPRQDRADGPGSTPASAAGCAPFYAAYRAESAATLLGNPGTLAVFGFGNAEPAGTDPRHLRIALPALDAPAPRECWTVDAAVSSGVDGDLRWARGGGWRFVAIEVDEAPEGGIEAAARAAYDRLLEHAAASPEPRILRIWNYLYAINDGAGDGERYRRFCSGRAASIAVAGLDHYPAATAIGQHGAPGRLQVYALCARRDGTAFENPRQVSAWNYPRQYGPASPQFARAMQVPGGALAISGTAAIVGHASHHAGDAAAQAGEALTNVMTLLAEARLPSFDADSLLKIYVRSADDLAAVQAAIGRRLDPAVPRLYLQGDVCRRELLVEIEGWRFSAVRRRTTSLSAAP